MKCLAMAVLSAVLAAVVYATIFYGGAFGMFWLMVGAPGATVPMMFTLWYLAAFLTGLILTRTNGVFAPIVTVPIAVAAVWGIGASLHLADASRPVGSADVILYLGLALSMGVTAFLGCAFATKAANRLSRFSVRWFQLVGPLAVLVCTTAVACVVRLMLVGNQVTSDIQRALAFCTFALSVIGLVTLANIVFLFARSYRSTREVRLS
jgi:hypothetical protein